EARRSKFEAGRSSLSRIATLFTKEYPERGMRTDEGLVCEPQWRVTLVPFGGFAQSKNLTCDPKSKVLTDGAKVILTLAGIIARSSGICPVVILNPPASV